MCRQCDHSCCFSNLKFYEKLHYLLDSYLLDRKFNSNYYYFMKTTHILNPESYACKLQKSQLSPYHGNSSMSCTMLNDWFITKPLIKLPQDALLLHHYKTIGLVLVKLLEDALLLGHCKNNQFSIDQVTTVTISYPKMYYYLIISKLVFPKQ